MFWTLLENSKSHNTAINITVTCRMNQKSMTKWVNDNETKLGATDTKPDCPELQTIPCHNHEITLSDQ